MKRFILTGTPGSGKTTLLRQLEIDGFSIVGEAATDLIALSQAQGIGEPWTDSSFLDAVVDLQRRHEMRAASEQVDVQFHDRSIVCTAALAAYLNFPFSEALTQELGRIDLDQVFQRKVFFLRNLGFVTPTETRRITYAEALRFEAIHEKTYRERGFDLIFVEPGTVAERVTTIKQAICE